MQTLKSISVENFLSLGKLDLKLEALNVLVGPNGSGKSNILNVFHFLGSVARHDLLPAIEQMGGFDEILFRGEERKGKTIKLKFTGMMTEHSSNRAPDEYTLSFWSWRAGKNRVGFIRRNEEIVLKRTAGRGRRITLSGQNINFVAIGEGGRRGNPRLSVQGTSTGLATLRRLGEEYEASGVEALAQVFEQLRLFEIDVEKVRRPSRAPSSNQLRQDARNLAPYLSFLREEHPNIFDLICEDVRFVLPAFRGFHFVQLGGADDAIRIDLVESGLSGTTPLARASFGTIRAIALFAMLNDPAPPKLTCLEEIDHGLHPHALDRLIERVREASSRTQIILATHSPALVNRLDPSELIVVERDVSSSATVAFRPDVKMVRRLSSNTGYELGELWFSGSLGGGLP